MTPRLNCACALPCSAARWYHSTAAAAIAMVNLSRLAEAEGERGTGLGLAIVRSVIEEHHGKIRLLESPRGGSRFELCLPMETDE